MNQSKKCTAIRALSALLCLLVLVLSGTAQAGRTVGIVANLSGVLLVHKADGGVKILAQQSPVDQGDTLVTQKAAYARIKFVDMSEITLKPDTQLAITDFTFSVSKTENDKEVLTLIQGGVRATSGLIGKRSKDRFQLITPSGSIDMGGAVITADYVPVSARAEADTGPTPGIVMAAAYRDLRGDSPAGFYAALTGAVPTPGVPAFIHAAAVQLAQNRPAPTSALPPGLYVQVIDGLINVTNKGGTQNFAAGQFGFTPNPIQPPVVVPKNPGLQFTPPPVFSQPTSPGSTSSAKSGTVDCVVR